jgi:L-aminopeptidase/D-esterase-like protein
VWASEGTRFTVEGSSPERVTLHVDDVPADGGEVVFSRLPWPGYTVTGGTLGDPLKGYLLRVEIPASSAGTDVVVTFRPPAWTVQMASLLLAGGLAVGLLVAGAVVAVRRRGGGLSRPR